jgi:surface antigen
MPPPVRAFTDAEGRICNVYAHQVTIDGGAQTAYATVCRQSNGRWVLVR